MTIILNNLQKQLVNQHHQENGVYSLFGWNAINSSPSNQYDPSNSGAGKTKQEAIINGAKMISNYYILQGRDTAYKMRWDVNPKGAKSQYATAVNWASARSDIMYHLYDSTQNDAIYKNQQFDLVVLKN